MTIKKRHSISDDPRTDENFDNIFSAKIESRFYYDGSSSQSLPRGFQSMYHGVIWYSANGSANVVRTFPLIEKLGTIVYANAHARQTGMAANVTDVTSTAVTVEVRSYVAGNVCAVTTASFAVHFQIVSSNP